MAALIPKEVPIPKNGVNYRGKVVLAPMVRSGELPSRLVALKHGADLVWGPETIDRALIGAGCRHNERTSTVEFTRVPSNRRANEDPKESIIYRIHPARESSKLVFQLGTASPDLAVQAAHVVAPYVAGIDVNAGCPKPFSTDGGMGAALLSTPDLLCSILRRLVGEIAAKYEIGISVKIRLLPTEEETLSLVRQLCQTGITGLTIHCRTRSMRKTQKAIRDQLRAVGATCRAAGVACLMNGDVCNRDEAEQLIREFEVDGAMIAEAAEKNLSVFQPGSNGGPASWEKVVGDYMHDALAVENRWGNTKFLLSQLIPGKAQEARKLSQMKNYADICDLLRLESLKTQAIELDARLDLTDRLTRSEQKANAKKARKDHNSSQVDAEETVQRKRPKLHAEENGENELDHTPTAQVLMPQVSV